MTFDTSGMLHTCGKRLVYKGIDNGCYVLVCLDKKCDGASYRLPIEDPRKLVSPCELITLPRVKVYNEPQINADERRFISELTTLPRVKVYTCRDCGAEITKEQALRTFREEGRALCVRCEGREHGIEIMGFE